MWFLFLYFFASAGGQYAGASSSTDDRGGQFALMFTLYESEYHSISATTCSAKQ
jgi:hypothetical protein